jgi:hypothetical protein
MKKFISTLLLISILIVPLGVPAQAYADNVIITPYYTHITTLFAGLSIDSSGLATCSGTVFPTYFDTNAELTVTLEEYKNNKWGSVYSWSAYGDGSAIIAKSGQRYVTSGRYRVVVTAKIYSLSGTLLETQSKTTTEKTY